MTVTACLPFIAASWRNGFRLFQALRLKSRRHISIHIYKFFSFFLSFFLSLSLSVSLSALAQGYLKQIR